MSKTVRPTTGRIDQLLDKIERYIGHEFIGKSDEIVISSRDYCTMYACLRALRQIPDDRSGLFTNKEIENDGQEHWRIEK